MPTYEELLAKLVNGTITPEEMKQFTQLAASGAAKNKPSGQPPATVKNPYSANTKYRTGTLQQDLPPTGEGEDVSLPVSYLMEAFRKGIYGQGPDAEQKFRKDLLNAGYENPKEQDMLVGLAAKQPRDLSVTELAHAKAKLGMKDDAIMARLVQSGFGDADAKIMMGLIDAQVKDSKPDLNISQMGKGMKLGQLKPDEAMAKLKDAGYSDADAKVLMGIMQSENKTKLPVSTLGDAYKRGDITREQLMTKLTKDNELSPEDAALVFKDITSNTKTGLGTTADLFKKGQIGNDDTYKKLTTEQGYNDKDARDLMAVWQKEAQEDAGDKQYRDQQRAQSAADRLERDKDRLESDARQKKNDLRQAKNDAENAFNDRVRGAQGTMFDDRVEGYMNDFKKTYVSQVKEANLGPQASQWLLDNPNLAVKAATTKGGGGVLNSAQLLNLYEGQRGTQRKQGQTNAAEISAVQI